MVEMPGQSAFLAGVELIVTPVEVTPVELRPNRKTSYEAIVLVARRTAFETVKLKCRKSTEHHGHGYLVLRGPDREESFSFWPQNDANENPQYKHWFSWKPVDYKKDVLNRGKGFRGFVRGFVREMWHSVAGQVCRNDERDDYFDCARQYINLSKEQYEAMHKAIVDFEKSRVRYQVVGWQLSGRGGRNCIVLINRVLKAGGLPPFRLANILPWPVAPSRAIELAAWKERYNLRSNPNVINISGPRMHHRLRVLQRYMRKKIAHMRHQSPPPPIPAPV